MPARRKRGKGFLSAFFPPAALLGLGRRKRVVRRRGRGLFDILGGIGGGVGNAVNKTLGGLFGGLGRRKRVVRRRGGLSRSQVYTMPMLGMRRRVRRRGGAPALEAVDEQPPTTLMGKLNKIARDSKIISRTMDQFGPKFVANAANTLGYGRRRKGHGYRKIAW